MKTYKLDEGIAPLLIGGKMEKCNNCGIELKSIFQENWNWGNAYCHSCYQKQYKNVFYPHCFTCKYFNDKDNGFCQLHEVQTYQYTTCDEYEEGE